MKKVEAASVRATLETHQASGFHVDGRLWREIDQPGEMFLATQMGPITMAVFDDTCGNLIQIAQK
jgi:hypothetical protein